MTHYVATYGYWAVILFLALEAFGIPIPGEILLIAAGTYAGTSHKLSVWLIWLFGFVGVEVGATAGFWLGVKGGYRLLRRYGRYIHMNESEIKIGRYVFDRYGGLVVSVGRFVAVLRTYAAFLAGTNRMNAVKFQLYNVVGAIAWTGTWALLSYYLGNTLKKASRPVDYAVGAVAVVLIVAGVLVVRRQKKRLEDAAEEAYPGALPD